MEYFDIDAILAEEEKVEVQFKYTAKKLGFLDPSSDEKDLQSLAKVELRLWEAEILQKNGMVDLFQPQFLGHDFLANFIAAPTTVVLNPYFYRIALTFASMFDVQKLLLAVQKGYAVRYLDILDNSMNLSKDEIATYLSKLTVSERKLFQSGYKATQELEQWHKRALGKLSSSSSQYSQYSQASQ